MSAEICGLKLFDDKQVKFVVIKLNASLKKGDLDGFLSFIKRFRHPGSQIRLSPSKADDDIEIADSLRLFDRTIDSVLAAYTGDMSVSEIKKKISDVMNFEMDNTQEDIPSQDNETKTKFEALDKNRANLTEHYKEFYGLDSYTIIQALQRTFSDRLSTAAYYSQFTGEMTDFDNNTLNLRIKDEKARMFKSLVEYLKQQYGEEAADFKSEMYDEDGKLDLTNYYNALNFFYDKVKRIDNFSEQLQTQQNNVLLEQEKKEKTDKYTALWNKLYLSDEFKKRADKKFTGFKARQAPTKLYEGENYSQYYAFLKKYIEKYGSDDDKKAISEIEKESPSLLSASQAYTMLTHFDQLIKETFGDNIDIQEGLENAEFDSDTKYSYHRDVKHEVKGWQTSEDVGAEKHTSQFTKTVLDMIGVFNYKTGEYTHRRVNSTSLIVASRNLMDALITHNITFKDIKIDSEYIPTPGEGRKNKNDYANELYSLARSFHANPVGNLQRILELLFSKQPGMSKALVDAIDIQNQQITGYDLNILKSVYNVVFDRENTNSFFAKASNKAGRENAAANVLLEEIAGYVDRNAVADYLESKFDYSTGLMKLSAKKKFFNVKDQFNAKTRVNQFVNSMTTDKLQSLADKYQLTEGQLGDSSAKIGKNTEYSIKIGDYTISLIVSNNIKAGIFGTVRPGQEGTMYFKVTKNEITPEGEEVTKDVTSDFFQKISNPNIGIATNFRYSKMHSLPLESEGARLLNGVLQFIDDTTGLGLLSNPSKNLQVLGTLQQLYSPIEGFHYFIQPLLRMAMKSAYAEKLRLDANKAGKPLAKYLSDTSNAAYMAYLRSKKSNRSFTEIFNDLRPVVATTFDQTINQWVDAESVLSGQASKATTKDSAGNSIPNNTVAKLGTNLVYYLQKEAAEDSKVRFLLFAQNPDMIVKTFHDLEVTNTEGETKAISDFTNGELFFQAIFNKFWDSYLATGHVIVQPTTYSDKTTFLNWELNPVYKGKNLMTMSKGELLNEYFETLGITTKRILDASTGKLNQIVQAYATGVKAKALEILNSTEKQEDKQVALDNFLNQEENRFFYTSTPQTDLNTMLHHITESQLVAQAQKMNLSVTLDHDYVRLKSGFCQLDSSLLFNQKLYNSTTEGGMLDRLLEKQKAIFVQQLLQNYCSYQVLTDGDTVSQYEADTIDSNVKSKNPIIKTILGYCDKQENKIKARTEFFKNWVDESTGKLIIAKQNGRNIMSLSDGFNPNEKVELNPLLDKFFYVEGFLSNQLRYTLTGFETNHPIKTQTQFDKLHKAYNGVVAYKFTSYDQVKQWLDSQSQLDKNQRDKNYSDIKFITDSSIYNQAHQAFRFNDLNDLGNYLYSEQGKADSAHSFLQDLWETSNIQILNNRQSTQFKRNVIIPATLQYCVQNSRDGIPPRIKCAVVMDDKAPVYNYRGDHEGDIDACDGSAQITPFQCILENRALGSQAVGFIKKPIWHSYDRESGTAFLAKFATDTMTNEAMRSSSASSVRLYNMFRKATNLQWNPADNIDLTRPITMEASISGAEGEALQKWFAKNITCNQPLCYKDKYGNIMEIKLLDRTVTQDGAKYYYTVEKDSYGNTVNKYHIFYDSVDENGNITKSKHYTFDTYQKAAKFVSEHQGAHTINSLFELHAALGGINSCNKEGIFGEYNNEVVCNYMCNIGSKKPGIKGTPYIDQTTYIQPLKQYQIGYILNNTAVKNGAKNINQKERWKDDEDLTWFEVDSDGLGMQMNADHDIVDSELTEFSQVIAATSAYGFTYNNCNEIFKGLASTAFQASQQPLVAVNKFLDALAAETDYTVTDAQGNTRPMTDTEAMEADAKNKIKISQAKSDLYDAIGRIIFMNSSIKDNENLTNIIQQAVLHVFNKYSNHEKDEVKLPFSDANIYSDFIATLASTINKNSIKRKHPGTGAVMAPAYNMQQYFEISTDNGPRKLMTSDVIRLAQEDYRRQLQDFLIQYGTHPVDESGNANTNIVKEATDEEGFGIGTARIAQLEKKAEQVANLRNKENKSKKSEDGSIPAEVQLPEYYNATHNVDDAHEANVKMLNIYLKQLQAKEPARSLEYFMPSDIVAVFNADGTAVKDKNGNDLIININDLKTYYNFKKGIAPDGTIIMHDMVLKKCTTAPNNLRPSIIRWQYTGADGTDHWMNIFDTPAIKNSWENRGPNYRAEVQATLNDVYNASEGNFNAISELNKNAEWLTGMKADTLENTDAELIMSNLYKDTFGVLDGMSLDQILDEGEDFFRRQTENLQAPKNNIYDYAFLRENGKHTLITIGNVTEDSQTVTEVPFTNITTEEHNAEGFADIYAVERGKKSFKIGRWINDGSVEYRDGKFIKDNQELDQSMYRVKDGIVQRKVNFVTRYNIKTKSTVKGVDFFKNNIMYKVATLDEIKEALRYTEKDLKTVTDDTKNTDALRQQKHIIASIFNAGDYKYVEINREKRLQIGKVNAIRNSLIEVLGQGTLDPNLHSAIEDQLDLLSSDDAKKKQHLINVKRDYLEKEAHKKWVSFQDSLKFIAARIPAQTLQSFMTMRLVGWTENSKNMAYVSHFQTYLQGSDYDIDKAYIMGQNYSANSVYVKWSPFFDFTTVKTLEESKKLPIPKGIKTTLLQLDETGTPYLMSKNGKILYDNFTKEDLDISQDVIGLLENAESSEVDGNGKEVPTQYIRPSENYSEKQRINYLKHLKNILLKIEKNGGYYVISDSNISKSVIDQIRRTIALQESYEIPESVAEQAYKNVASANIYAVASDIRNRDQAYTAIGMSDPRRAADNSPKGEQTAHLNMLNPFTKYVMQYQNLVGKKDIGIFANAEKFWFNDYYYWTKILKSGNLKAIEYLKYQVTLNRIKDRAKNAPIESTTRVLPDLDLTDEQINSALTQKLGVALEEAGYKYVDQAISQMLSAATDNAKELILAKLNAGTNYAKMYAFLIVQGYSIDDIAAFMTSPIGEFIDSRSNVNMFQTENGYVSAATAIKLSKGILNANNFLHGSYPGYEDPVTGDYYPPVQKSKVVRDTLVDFIKANNQLEREVRIALLNGSETDPDALDNIDLNTLMSGVIQAIAKRPDIQVYNQTFNLYSELMNFDSALNDDPEVVNYIRNCWDLTLQLQGVVKSYRALGMSEQDMIADADEFQKIYNYSQEMTTVASAVLGLNQGLPTSELDILKRIRSIKRVISDRENLFEVKKSELYPKTSDDEKKQAKIVAAWQNLIERLQENNPTLTEDKIVRAFDAANEADIINNFDPVKMMNDSNYRRIAKDYLDVLKGTVNAIDMVYQIPHYAQIMNCLKLLVTANNLAMKSRLIIKLTQNENYLSDKQLQGVIRYVDALNSYEFCKSLPQFILPEGMNSVGYDSSFAEITGGVDSYDLSTMEGIAGFKHFVETTFLQYLRDNHKNNPLVKHLTLTEIGNQSLLTTDIDLMNPNITSQSEVDYGEILTGMARFENTEFGNGENFIDYPDNKHPMTIADVLQLYNIIVNRNQYGSERLTTAFKACSRQTSILNKYFNFVGTKDYDYDFVPDYKLIDYQINAAPLISQYAMKFHTEPFVKVKDPVWTYIVYRRNSDNSYSPYAILPPTKSTEETPEQKEIRRMNYMKNSPFEMPSMAKTIAMIKSFIFEGEPSEAQIKQIKDTLIDQSMSGRILILKKC